MSDYIPRLYAIAAIENQIVMHEPKEGDSQLIEAYHAGFRTAMEQVRLELMNIKSKTDWIPVEMGLPKKKGTYIVSDTFGFVHMAEFVSPNRAWWSIDFNKYVHDIVAWMPKPDAYIARKEVKKNG